MLQISALIAVLLFGATVDAAASPWQEWPPREYLLKSLVEEVPKILDTYHPETGRFGTEPWICTDQNVIFPLAAAWAIKDPANPWYHDEKLLQAIAKGGEVLVDEMDPAGMWTFRKKDNSTWGQIHMPWTYSRWIRAYALVRDALPQPTREKWERGLLLGFKGIRKYAGGGIHNIPTHHAMALMIAGVCFNNEEWQQAARQFMARVVQKQDPVGFWSEHFGPVIGYNAVYVEALGIYYHFSKDPVVLDALRRAARFHASVLWPDGSSVACIDERQIYHRGINTGNVGLSWTPEGRGFLLKQLALYAEGGKRLASADYAATMLLYGGSGTGLPPTAERDEGSTILGDGDALIRRAKPWQWALSGYACKPINNRWIQDRHNLVDLYHDALGLVAGGGNTKLQPYWSTFTVGDPSLLRHTPGDESPQFVPEIDLRWTPDTATLQDGKDASILSLAYGDVKCSVAVHPQKDGALHVTYRAPRGQRVEGHLPLLRRSAKLRTAKGETVRLGSDEWVLAREKVGDHFVYGGLKVTLPPGASLRWPAYQHDPYKKDGSSSIGSAKLVVVLPFTDVEEQTVVLSHESPSPFDGLAFEARDLRFTHSEGTYTKRLDDLGSQFIGRTKVGSTLTFTLPEVKPGRYELLGEFVMAHSYGIVRVLLDGKPVGQPFDGYCDGVDGDGERVSFGQVELGAGPHEVSVELIGKNEKATAMLFSVKRWLLRPIGR